MSIRLRKKSLKEHGQEKSLTTLKVKNNNKNNEVPFKRVILYARQHRANQGVSESLHRLVDFLKTKDLELYQDEETASGFEMGLPLFAQERHG